MTKINSEHLIAIFGNIASEVLEEDLSKIISYLNGEVHTEELITNILDSNKLMQVFFQTRRDLSTTPETIQSFKDTATFTARLSLLIQACGAIKPAHTNQLKKQYLAHARQLIQGADAIFTVNDLDAQLYLLNQLTVWQEKEQNPELKRQIFDKLKLCPES